ncbi:MAG: hypothetical protein H7293_15295 [Candidatus Saccharibacteria bacterium]|nr:hypothetical protein [Rhodoferax sp.]
MTILLIAILPALAVLLIAGMTGSRFWTWMAVFAAGAVGVLGQSKYLVLDLAAVAVASWVSLAGINGRPKPAAAPRVPVKAKPSGDHGVAALVALLVVAAAVFVSFAPSTQTPVATQAQPAPAASAVKQMSAVPPAKAPMPVDRQSQKRRSPAESKVKQDQRVANSAPVQRANQLTPLEQCLTIPSEAGMSRCLERLK